jgi:ABC-2 type transport system ATP-binding protein
MLDAFCGQVLFVLGPNGSGKTTLLRLASGALLPDAGQVLVEGHDTSAEPEILHRNVAYCIGVDRSFFPRLTVRENLDFFAAFENIPSASRRPEIERVLAAAGICEFRDVLAMKLSSGTYQKLGIARALLKNPAVLLLDEPARSLDPGASEHLWEAVRNLADCGSCVIVASHNFQEAIRCGDRIAVLSGGNLLATRSTEEDVTIEELQSFYFGLVGESAMPLHADRIGV